MFYPSKVYVGKVGHPYDPEFITGRVMLNPKYRIKRLASNTKALCDSGAFQDIDKNKRLMPEEALNRQLKYRNFIRDNVVYDASWEFESICIYDQMIGVDECIIDGKKKKVRGTVETGKIAVDDTLQSAHYYYTQRQTIPSITYIAQGVNSDQYVECTKELLTLMRPNIDYFGFGGFCIIGKQRKTMLPLFYETVYKVLPLLEEKGITRIHLLGVCIPDAVRFAVQESKKYGIHVSTDSSAPEMNAVAFGRTYNDDMRLSVHCGTKWVDYNPIELAHENVRKYHLWMKSL